MENLLLWIMKCGAIGLSSIMIIIVVMKKIQKISNSGKKLPRWRWLNFLFAVSNNYFWSRCPICQRYFGGHENLGWCLMDSYNSGRLVCYKKTCIEEAQQWNYGGFGRRTLGEYPTNLGR